MPTPEPLPADKQINVLRIIIAAMAMGALVFGVVVNAVLPPAGGAEPEDGLMTKVGLVIGLIALLAHRTIAALVLAKGLGSLPADEEAARSRLMTAKTTSTIVACAMLEGALFLNLVVYGFLEGQPVSMAMAALQWLAIALRFPLPGSLETWMDAELRAAREERAAKG